jgi:hypothetical protein
MTTDRSSCRFDVSRNCASCFGWSFKRFGLFSHQNATGHVHCSAPAALTCPVLVRNAQLPHTRRRQPPCCSDRWGSGVCVLTHFDVRLLSTHRTTNKMLVRYGARWGFVAQSGLRRLAAPEHDRTQGRQDALEDHQLGRVQRCAQSPRVVDDLAERRHAVVRAGQWQARTPADLL